MDNEALIRHLYSVAEIKDFQGFVELFTEDGTFTDESIGVTYRGHQIARTGEVMRLPPPKYIASSSMFT